MKTHLVLRALPALLLPPTLLLAQSAYTVQGQLGAKAGYTHAYLVHGEGAATRVDSTYIHKGRFGFKGIITAPEQAQLLVTKQMLRMPFRVSVPEQKLFLQPGTIRITSSDSLTHVKLGGTSLNADQQRLATLTQATTARKQAILAEWHAASPAKRKDKTFEASIDERYNEVEAANNVLVKQFIHKNPNSLVSLYALEDMGGFAPDAAVVGPLFEGLSPAVRQSTRGQKYATKLDKMRKLAIGAVAPDFTQADATGKLVKLSDFRGKYVLVDFWASWCGPCRRENPNVVANYNKYKDKNFTVLGVSLDQPSGRDAWLKAIDTDGLAWTQVSDLKGWKNEAAQLYDINAIPQNLLIGPDGRIVAKNVRGDELGQKLAVVLTASAQ